MTKPFTGQGIEDPRLTDDREEFLSDAEQAIQDEADNIEACQVIENEKWEVVGCIIRHESDSGTQFVVSLSMIISGNYECQSFETDCVKTPDEIIAMNQEAWDFAENTMNGKPILKLVTQPPIKRGPIADAVVCNIIDNLSRIEEGDEPIESLVFMFGGGVMDDAIIANIRTESRDAEIMRENMKPMNEVRI